MLHVRNLADAPSCTQAARRLPLVQALMEHEEFYIENKTTKVKLPLIGNSTNGLWYMNGYHLPKYLIANLGAGDFHRQGR